MNTGAAPLPAERAPRCTVSVIINAFNDEDHVAAAIESSLAAVGEVGGEVVLADGNSTDRTVEIASRYPIRIVQLLNPSEQCRGITPQLGFQHSRGDYLYILDADSQMLVGFLPRALAFLAQHPEAAAVGGRLLKADEMRVERQRTIRIRPPRRVDQLDGGGLYRRRAVDESGYLTDRNLHSHEEFELALRLQTLGWKLWRIPVDVTTHPGFDGPPYQLLMRQWRNRSVWGLGELVRAAAAQSRLRLVLRRAPALRICLGVLAWWALLLSAAFWPFSPLAGLAAFATLAAAPWLLILCRQRSPRVASYSLLSWCLNTAGLVRGVLRQPRAPREAIASRVLQEPPQTWVPRREHYA